MGQRPEEAIVYIRFNLIYTRTSHALKNLYLSVYSGNIYAAAVDYHGAIPFTLHQARRHINKLLTGNVFIGYKVTKAWMDFGTPYIPASLYIGT